MELKMFSIRDSKGNVFLQPFYCLTDAEAERHLVRLTRDQNSNIHYFPEDFDLYFVGTFDTETGVLNPLDTPTHILKAVIAKDRDSATKQRESALA